MSATENRERRNHFRGKPRPGRRVEVEYKLAGGQPVRAHTRNVGVGGAFIVTTTPLPNGTILDVKLLVPNGEGLVVKAEVRWVVPEGEWQGMGVKFASLEVDELLALNEYFASLTGTDAE
jgi:uncharacterized protein (TIGR02266 family)